MKEFDKKFILEFVIQSLKEELGIIVDSASQAHADATHEESKAENKYDTRGLEASYLAQGQAQRASELKTQLGQLERMPLSKFTDEKPIGSGALVFIENEEGEEHYYFLLPFGGGVRVSVKGRLVQVVSLNSPIGKSLLGKRIGDEIKLKLNKKEVLLEVVDYI